VCVCLCVYRYIHTYTPLSIHMYTQVDLASLGKGGGLMGDDDEVFAPQVFSNHSFSFRVFICIEICKYIFASQVALAPSLSVFFNIFIFTFLFIFIFFENYVCAAGGPCPLALAVHYQGQGGKRQGKKNSQKCSA